MSDDKPCCQTVWHGNRGRFSHYAKVAIEIAAMTLAYFVAGRIGLLFGSAGNPTPVWPAAGIALAGTLLFGYRIAPGICLGSILVNFSSGLSSAGTSSIFTALVPAASIGLGASLQAILGAFLIRRLVPYPTDFVEARQIIIFLFVAGPVSCLVGATWAVTTLLWSGVIQPSDYLFQWGAWWMRYVIGIFTCTFPVLVWSGQPPAFTRRRQVAISAPLLTALVLVVLSYLYIDAWEQDRIKQTFGRRTDSLAQQLRGNLEDNIEVLQSLESLYTSAPQVTRQQFKTIAASWFSRRPSLRTLSWNPVITDAERARYEQAARRDGVGDFEIKERNAQGLLVRAPARAEYTPYYFLETVRGN